MRRLVLLAVAMLSSAVAWSNEIEAVYRREATWAASMAATRQRILEEPSGRPDDGDLLSRLCRRFWEDFSETDWLLQDSPGRDPDAALDPWRSFGWYFDSRETAQEEERLIRRVLAELRDVPPDLSFRLDRLVGLQTAAGDPAWLEVYVDSCRLRRQQRLAILAEKAPRFVFTKHYTLGGSHYAYTEGQSDAQDERHFVPGAALCVARIEGDRVDVETLLEDRDGVIRDPDVSYDGRRVAFAWKKADLDDDYHLYEIDVQSRSVRQLTEGLGVADYEPAWLPDGDVIFNSTRCVQTVDCWWTEVSNLYRCDGDGRFLRRLTFDQVHDNFPTLTADGRVLYTRWEYNDRGQIYTQPLLQMNADGTGQTEFYGANSWFPTTILHARSIPGTQKVLAIATGHHSPQTGKLIVIDPAKGRQENEGVQLVAPRRDTPAVQVDSYGQEGELFQYPYPLSETEYLATYHPAGWPWASEAMGPHFGIYFMTADGRRELLVRDSELPCSQPVPLRARTAERVPSSLVDYRATEGSCYIQDVYAGGGLIGMPRGTVRRVRVVAIDYRAAGIGENRNGGPGGSALISTPVAIGNGTWDVKAILGEAQVYDDGSAFFRVPARTPLYFQLLDDRGRLVQTMRSWTTLQPGENASCVGCHEAKNTTPIAERAATKAFQAGCAPLEPFYGEPRGFSFRREIQPILDRFCVRCHDGAKGNAFALTGREVVDDHAKRIWTESYLALTHARPVKPGGWLGDPDHPMLNWMSAQSAPPMQPPYAAGSGRSQIIELLEESHEGVILPRDALSKIAAWIDLGVPYCGDYQEAHSWTPEEWEKYEHFLAKRKRLAAEEQAGILRWLRGSSESP